jgi:hypothetical protein
LFVFDLPFQAEEWLCPEALGKNHSKKKGIDIIDMNIEDENGVPSIIRQAIVAVHEKLPDNVDQERTERRSLSVGSPGPTNNFGAAGGGTQQYQYNYCSSIQIIVSNKNTSTNKIIHTSSSTLLTCRSLSSMLPIPPTFIHLKKFIKLVILAFSQLHILALFDLEMIIKVRF